MSIPIRDTVKVSTGVVTPSGGIDQLTALLLTKNKNLTKAQSFTSAEEVARLLTDKSLEAQMARIYFAGDEGQNYQPSKLIIAPYTKPSQSTDWTGILDGTVSSTDVFQGFTILDPLSLQEKQAIAQWVGAQSGRYWCVLWDNDTQAVSNASANTSFGAWLFNQGNNIPGITPVYNNPDTAVFCLSWMASLEFSLRNGRVPLKFASSPVVNAVVNDEVTAQALLSNGYSFMGNNGNGRQTSQWMTDGKVSGSVKWADSYIIQIWLKLSFEEAFVNLLKTQRFIPYNSYGDNLIGAAAQDVIDTAVNFGAIGSGSTLSSSETADANGKLGPNAANAIYTDGYFFKPNASSTSPSDRSEREAPPSQLWYEDNGSVQSLKLSVIGVQ